MKRKPFAFLVGLTLLVGGFNLPTLANGTPVKSTVIYVEGEETHVELEPVQLPDPWASSILAYSPANMVATVSASDVSCTVRFNPSFGGQPNDKAIFEVTVYKEKVSEIEALARAERQASLYHLEEVEKGPTYPGARKVFRPQRFAGKTTELIVGTHGQTFFTLLSDYPGEYGDGLYPRIQLILKQWQWPATGVSLYDSLMR